MRPRSTPPRTAEPKSRTAPVQAPARAPDPVDETATALPRARLSLPMRTMLAVALPMACVHSAAIAALWLLSNVPTTIAFLVGGIGLAGSLAGGVLAYRAGRRVAGRVAEVASVLQRVQDGDYRPRLAIDIGDELGVLAHRVNRLVEAAAKRERRLMENALVDPLTGLHNRSLLTDRVRSAIAIAQRTKAPFSIAVLDLDRFKMVNDTLGHGVGDQLLKEVARRLKQTVRESDTVARLGGDEFVLLLNGGAEAALEVSDRVLEAMAKPLQTGGQVIDIGISMGIALYPEHGQDDATLLRHADAAMYRAKHQRSGRQIFDGDSKQIQRGQLSLLSELRAALARGQFELEYQPQLNMKSGLIVGLEGLVRWNHPTRGRIPPNEFIPFAEESGFMRELTQWVLAEGARFAAELVRAGLKMRVSLNVAAQDIEHPGFCESVGRILAQTALDPKQLCLEITESGVVSETENAIGNLKRIAAQGVLFSVDDFGTGYSTLKQLQRLPVHELKIDRSFVTGLHQNRGNESIVRTTIDLAKQLGLTVVAEGVETLKELRTLATMGCDEVQGYFLSKPLPAAEVVAWVEMRNALHASSREMYFEMLTGSKQ